MSGADTTTTTDGTAGPARTRSVLVPVGAFVVWTLFVWIGRIRNAVTDPALSGSDRIGPLVLSGIFVVGALVLGALLYRDHAMRSAASARMLRNAVRAFAGYTVVIWVVRAGDIAFGGDHEAAFVVVHTVLAAVSIALAVVAVLSVERRASVRPT